MLFRHHSVSISAMKISPQLLDLLQCPVSSEALTLSEHTLATASGNNSYPLVAGIPWLIAHPRNSLLDWGAKLNHFQQIFLQEIAQIEVDLKSASGLTHDRLHRLVEAKRAFLLQITTLFEALTQTKVAASSIYDALRDRAPRTQNLLSYEANIYRDWVWGEEENVLSAKIVSDLFPEKVGKLAVLGAGACRLALDIHRQCQPELTVATDINPLFLLLVDKLLSGKTLALSEFPLQPKSHEHIAKLHTISAIENPPENFYLCFADAAKPAFKKEAFDILLTPWLIDIQPHALLTFLKQLNHYLPLGGAWVNFGSLVFHQDRDALCYSAEEITAIAKEAGFVVDEPTQYEIPYLKSPHNAGYRMETVWAWRATKVESVSTEVDLQTMPAWLLDLREPVPMTEQFKSMRDQNQFLAELYQKVDGRKSIESLAAYFASKDGSDPEEIKMMLTQYFLRFYA